MRTKIAILLAAVLTVVLAGVALAGPGKSFSDAEFKAELSGDNEVPPVETNTTGEAKFTREGDTLHFELEIFAGHEILGAVGAHIHCAPVGEDGPIVAFLAGEVPGGFDGEVEIKASLNAQNLFDAETDCGATWAEVLDSIANGETYVNVHSPDHGGGEIRGQIESTS